MWLVITVTARTLYCRKSQSLQSYGTSLPSSSVYRIVSTSRESGHVLGPGYSPAMSSVPALGPNGAMGLPWSQLQWCYGVTLVPMVPQGYPGPNCNGAMGLPWSQWCHRVTLVPMVPQGYPGPNGAMGLPWSQWCYRVTLASSSALKLPPQQHARLYANTIRSKRNLFGVAKPLARSISSGCAS